jgi:hypothetical protein
MHDNRVQGDRFWVWRFVEYKSERLAVQEAQLLEKERHEISEDDLNRYFDAIKIQLQNLPLMFICHADRDASRHSSFYKIRIIPLVSRCFLRAGFRLTPKYLLASLIGRPAEIREQIAGPKLSMEEFAFPAPDGAVRAAAGPEFRGAPISAPTEFAISLKACIDKVATTYSALLSALRTDKRHSFFSRHYSDDFGNFSYRPKEREVHFQNH